MDRGDWQAIVQRVANSRTQMSDFNFRSERVKDTEEPGMLQSMRSQRVGYNLLIKESQDSFIVKLS